MVLLIAYMFIYQCIHLFCGYLFTSNFFIYSEIITKFLQSGIFIDIKWSIVLVAVKNQAWGCDSFSQETYALVKVTKIVEDTWQNYQFFITEGLKGLEEFSELMLILSGLKIIIPKLEVSLLSVFYQINLCYCLHVILLVL